MLNLLPVHSLFKYVGFFMKAGIPRFWLFIQSFHKPTNRPREQLLLLQSSVV